MKTATIEIVDRGRGPQLSSSRITLLDLIPYFQTGCNHADIIWCMPTLTSEEIDVAYRYYLANRAALDEADRKATAYREEQIRLQKLRFPDREETGEQLLARLRELVEKRKTGESR